MGRQVEQVRLEYHNHVLDVRATGRIVDSLDFVRAWEKATETDRDTMQQYMNKADYHSLKRLIRKILVTDFEIMNYDELRHIAQLHRIQGYSTMNKADLVRLLKDYFNDKCRKTS